MRLGAVSACAWVLAWAGCSGTGQYGNELDSGELDAGADAGPDAGRDASANEDAGALRDAQVAPDAGEDGGKVEVTVDIVPPERLRCPIILGFDALPSQTGLGGKIALTAWVSNGTRLVTWSGEGGTFSTTISSKTTFTCTEAGTHALFAVPERDPSCSASMQSVLVECGP